jgi:hypothetical protein
MSMRVGRRGGCGFVLLVVAFVCQSIAAQQIAGDPLWGFDGTVVPNRFNLLTVRVRNDTNEPIHKHLQLVRSAGGIQRGAPMVQSCYLGPGTSRVVQFHPFIVSSADVWRLSWVEGGAAGQTVMQAPAAMPATVLLEEEPLKASRRLRLRAFPPRLLPASATAMGALRAIVIDREPELSQAQRTALLAWLRRGGELHMLLRNSSHVTLKDDFAVLNSEEYVIAYGSGRVFRHPFDRFALKKEIPEELFGGFRLETPAYQGGTPVSFLLRKNLREDVKLEFGWGLIFALAVVYLALIGPVLYRLSTNRLSWPLSLVVLAGMIAVATWVFSIVGARGNDEKAKTKSWTFARLDGDERYEVTRFANVFITTGGDYKFGDGDAHGLFSSAQTTERINGEISNGAKARYSVDMPRFSDRFIVHKSVVAGPEAEIEFDGERLRIELDIASVVSVSGDKLYRWTSDGPGYFKKSGPRVRLRDLLRQNDLKGVLLDHTVIERMHLRNMDLRKPVTRRDHHVFFCVGPTPAEFRLKGKGPDVGIGREDASSRTVYRFERLLEKK